MGTIQAQLLDFQAAKNSASVGSPRATSRAAPIDLNVALRSHQTSLETTLKTIFPDQREESKLQKSRRILGDTVADLSDEELGTYLTEFQYLIDSWLDNFEKQIFNEKTLAQLLREG